VVCSIAGLSRPPLCHPKPQPPNRQANHQNKPPPPDCPQAAARTACPAGCRAPAPS
jgi:hypothetical protein